MKVACIGKVEVKYTRLIGKETDQYEIGKVYQAKYLYDRCLVEDNDYIEFEWQVFCSDHNHYQFTDEDFKKYFVDIAKHRNKKIENILE